MFEDRNKTELTKEVTAAVYRYLDERGFKPLETEVSVCDGWVADIAGVLIPTETELQELKIIPRKPRWDSPHIQAWQDQMKQRDVLMTGLVEVKTSMSDFRGDKKWTENCPTNLAYLAIPKALPLEKSQFPNRWGVLEYNESSGLVRIIQPPTFWAVSIEQQMSVTLSVAIRRDHHTRHARLREFQREARLHEGYEVTRRRIGDCMRAVLAVVQGGSMGGRLPHASIEEALEFHSIKNLSGWDMEQLQKLWRAGAKDVASNPSCP